LAEILKEKTGSSAGRYQGPAKSTDLNSSLRGYCGMYKRGNCEDQELGRKKPRSETEKNFH
jgi:hypothetical protein